MSKHGIGYLCGVNVWIDIDQIKMEIRNLEYTDFDILFQSFEKAFADYEIHFEKEEERSMLKRRVYNPKLSFAAFVNGEMAAFTLNGTGLNGIPTAYDTGTGTVKKYRGQGVAGKFFTYSIPFLKEAGIKQYLLEVLQSNRKAITVYRRMNFEVTREFDCFRQTIKQIDLRGSKYRLQHCTGRRGLHPAGSASMRLQPLMAKQYRVDIARHF